MCFQTLNHELTVVVFLLEGGGGVLRGRSAAARQRKQSEEQPHHPDAVSAHACDKNKQTNTKKSHHPSIKKTQILTIVHQYGGLLGPKYIKNYHHIFLNFSPHDGN